MSHLKDYQQGKSSHWAKYLQDFSFSDKDGFQNIMGFGGIAKRSIANHLFHSIMQIPFKLNVKSHFDISSDIENAKYIAKKQHRLLDIDILRQVFTMSLCKKMIPDFPQLGNHLVIGDGFGVLSSLIILGGGKSNIY